MTDPATTTPTTTRGSVPFMLQPLRQHMDRMFAEFMRGLPSVFTFGGDAQSDFWPTAELTETDKDATIRVELPGVEAKDVEIVAADDSIAIRGEKRSESEKRDGDRVTTECSYGSFSRTFSLGYPIDADKVDAKFDKGVLTIHIPRPAQAVPSARRIEIH